MNERDETREVTIRQTSLEDVEPIRKMHAVSWRETYPNDEADVSQEWVDEYTERWLTSEALEKSRSFMAEVLNDPGQFHRVATDGGKVVGMVHVSRKDGKQHFEALYVDKAYYGTGLAQRLMDQAMSWTDDSIIDLEVAGYNKRAIRFYEKYGFKIVPNSEHLFADKIPIVTMVREQS